MKKLIAFLKNNWTLRTVIFITILYAVSSYIFGDGLELAELIIFFLVFLYFVWGFGKRRTT